jgi:hypothetical protein
MSKNKEKFIKISELEYKSLLNENADLKHKISEFELTIKDLQKTLFGSKTEKTKKTEIVDFNQLALFEENNPDETVELENTTPKFKGIKRKNTKQKKKARKKNSKR